METAISTLRPPVALLAMLFVAATTQAATITVTNTNDSGPGSLRAAVATAAPLDTIDFSLSGCPCTITQTSGEIVIDKALYVTGPGAGVGRYRIFTMTADGASLTRVTNSSSNDFEPALSPDKRRIAFARGLLSDIYVMNADGITGLTRLTTDHALNSAPAWSPDGTKIAFHSFRYAGIASLNNAEIVVMDANGTNVRRLTSMRRRTRRQPGHPTGRRSRSRRIDSRMAPSRSWS